MADPEVRPSPSAEDIAEAAAGLRRLMGFVADGTLTATHGLIARLEGAALALEALGEASPDTG